MVYLIEVKKSKFYSQLFSVYSKNDVEKILKNAKKEYKKATHFCFIYKFRDENQQLITGQSDDGEPKGSATKPMQNISNHYNMENFLLLIVRYYGGTKLGAGVLTRTYSKSAKMVCDRV